MRDTISPKTISRLNWMMIIQSPVTPKMVYAMQSIEGLLNSFYAIILQQRTIQTSILTVFLLTLFFYLAKEQKRVISNHYEIVRGIGYQVLGTMLLIFSYVLYIPLIDIIISNAIYAQSHSQIDKSYITYLALSIYSIIIYAILLLYSRRLFKLNMMSGDKIASWSQPDSRLIYAELINKIIMPIILAFDRKAAFILYEVIFILISQALLLIFILMFSAPFNKVLVYIQIGFQVIIVFLLEIGVLKYFIGNRDNKEGIIFFFFIVFIVYSFYELNKWRSRKVLFSFQQNQLKKNTEYEQVFLILINLAQDCINELMSGKPQKSSNQMPQLFKMIEQHMVNCGNAICLCNHYETFIEMFKVSYQRGQGQMLLNQQKFHLMYDIMFADQRYAKFYTSISRTLPNPNGLRDAEQNYDFKQDKTLMSKISQQVEHESEQSEQVIQEEDEEGEEKIFILDQVETQKFFIINFIKIFLDGIRAKFPDSMHITNAFNYFTLFLLEKPQLSLISLKQFAQTLKNPSWVDLVSQNINEHYILYYYEIYNQSNKDYSNYKIDAEAFISINNLYSQFHQDIEDLSLNTISFWKGFTFEQLDPFSQIKIGEKISTQIKLLYDKFLLIERTLTSKDPKLYLWFGLVQQKIINDSEGYHIFINKMKEVNQAKKLHFLEFKVKSFDQESGFILVDGKSQSQGQILMMNKSLRRVLKRDEEEIKFLNINSLMPSLIQASHQKFMEDYNKTGQSKILNKKVMHFCKDKNSNLIPIEALVKFHYSQVFNYCFVALIDPVIQMRPFRDDTTYQSNQLLYLSIDWNNGQITESSENFSQLVKKSEISSLGSTIFQEKVITLDNIFENFNFRAIKNLKRKSNNPRKNFYEGIFQIDMFQFNDVVDNRQIFNQTKKTLLAKIALYYESYGNDYLKMGYVAVSLDIGENKLNRSILTPDHNTKSYHRYNSDQMMKIDLEEEKQVEQDYESSVGSSHSSSIRATIYDVKSFHSFYQQSTPRILKVVLQMVILLILVTLTISTVNLGLSISNQIKQNFEIQTVKAAYKRINHTISNRMLLRILMNIANGYEPNNSSLIADRFTVYKKLQEESVLELRASQQFLDNSGISFDSNFQNILDSPSLKITYLNEKNQQYSENVTMKVAQNLLMSRLQQINQYSKSQMKGNLRIQTLTPNETSKYIPSLEEQTLFFTVINANGVIREFNNVFVDNYIEETKVNSEQRLQQSVILTILSVITILIVSLVISPIISQTEERKYNALVFFLRIPQDQILIYIQRCQDCLKLEEESNLRKRGRGTLDQTINGVENKLEQYNQIAERQDEQQNDYSYNDDTSLIAINPDIAVDTQVVANQVISNSIYSTMNGINLYDTNRNMVLNNILDGQILPDILKPEIEIFKDLTLQKKKTFHPKSKTLGQNLNQLNQLKQNSIQESDTSIQVSITNIRGRNNIPSELEIDTIKNEQQKVQNQEDLDSHMELNMQKEQIIKKIAFRQKVKTFLGIISLTLTCSFYFIATFFLSQNNQKQAASSVDDLGIIISKDMCFENLINFQRENIIRNQSVIMTENSKEVASQYFLTQCSGKEVRYRNIRRNIPSYLNAAKNTLDKMETKDFCDNIYSKNSQFYELNSYCKTALNGVFQKGLTSALAYMYHKAQKTQMEYDTALQMRQRDQTFLRNMMNDTETIELIDAKVYILQHAFQVFQDACVDSSIKYFQSQRDQLIIIYVVFLVIIIVSILIFFLYALKRLRSTMWNTNLILKIIPSDVVSKKDAEKIKSFFVN